MSEREPEASSLAKAVEGIRMVAVGSLRSGGNTAEDLLNDFEWKLAGLVQIAQTTQDLWREVDPRMRWKLGMSERTAEHVWSLFYDFDDMRERITLLEDRAWKPVEANDGN